MLTRLIKGDLEGKSEVLVRMHSECMTGDVFGSLRCDCGEQLEAALANVDRELPDDLVVALDEVVPPGTAAAPWPRSRSASAARR